MATFVSVNLYCTVAGTDLADHIESAELKLTGDDQDFTNFGSAGWKEGKIGLKGGSITLLFQQDYAASKVDATLWAAFLAGTPVTIVVRPTSAAAGATNPQTSASFNPTEYAPVMGKVGDKAGLTITWPMTGAPTRTP